MPQHKTAIRWKGDEIVPTKKSKKRIEIIDVAKCIAIFMVVLGHSATNSELLNNPPLLFRILYSIHMPLFFFLSGLSISPKTLKNWGEWRFFLRKTVLTIAIPYLIWALVFCNFSFENLGWILYGSWIGLGKTGTVTSLWYLACLFVARILVQLAISLMVRTSRGNNRLIYLIPATVCMAVGVLLPTIEIGYPWCFNVACVAAGFILLGMAVKNGVIELSVQKGWVLLSLLAASVAVFSLFVYLRGDSFGMMLMAAGYYGDPFFALVFAVIGGFAVLALSMILKRMANEWLSGMNLQPLNYLGQHTMGVFLLHKPMLQNIFIPAFGQLLPGGPDILVRLLATTAAILVSMWLCKLIEYYIPELVGIFSKDKIMGTEKT